LFVKTVSHVAESSLSDITLTIPRISEPLTRVGGHTHQIRGRHSVRAHRLLINCILFDGAEFPAKALSKRNMLIDRIQDLGRLVSATGMNEIDITRKRGQLK